MRARGGWGLLLLLTIATLAAPASAATKAEGSFTARGTITIQGDLSATMQPLAILVNRTAQIDDFSATATRADVCIYEQTIQEVAIAGQGVQAPERKESPRCASHANLQIAQAKEGDAAGWLGIDPSSGALAFAGDSLTAEERGSDTLSSEPQVVSGEDDQPFFVERVFGPLLHIEKPGVITYTGGGTLKVKGVDFWLVSDGHRSQVETGEWVTESGNVRERFARWVVVRFTEGTVTATTPAPVQVAARDATADFTGTLHMAATGTLTAGSRTYNFTGQPEAVTGRFTAYLEPQRTGTTDVTLSGDLHTASLAPVPAPVTATGKPSVAAVALVVGAGVGVGGAVAYVVMRYKRRHPRPRSGAARSVPVVAEPALVVTLDAEARARAFVAEGITALGASANPFTRTAKLAEAEAAFRRAWESWPRSGDAALGLGLVQVQCEEWAAAILSFLRASFYMDTGEPEVRAARCALRLGEKKAAARFLLAGLHRDNLTRDVFDIVYVSDELRAVVVNPGPFPYTAALQAAWEDAVNHFLAEDEQPDGRGWR